MNRTTDTPPPAGGFSLVETMVAVLLVSLAALLLVQASRSNAAARSQSLIRASAVRLGTELAEWTRRGGHQALGMPLAQALLESLPPASLRDCHDPAQTCDPQQAARHYLSRWQSRLREAIADARLVVCTDHAAGAATGDWECNPDGHTQVLKIGNARRDGGMRPAAIIDLGIAP